MRNAFFTLLTFAFILSCGASQRERTVRASFIGVGAARDGFVVWDGKHQEDLVDAATSREEGEQALADYRKERERVVALFEAAYRLVAAAAISEEASIPDMLAALKELHEAVKRLREGGTTAPSDLPRPAPVTGLPKAPPSPGTLPTSP